MTFKSRLLKIAAFGLIAFFMFSCSPKMRTLETGILYRMYPPPPAMAKIQFLTSFSTSKDIIKEQSLFMRYVTGEDENKPITKPYGIAVQNDKIYICDTMLPGLEIIDLQINTFDYFVPEDAGVLKKPINCALDELGRLYVADTERKQILIFDAAGRFISVIGDGQLLKPTDVAIHDKKIWVCDLQNHQIHVYTIESQSPMFSFPEQNTNMPRYLFSPTNLCIEGNKVYVTDTGDSKVKVFDLQGNFLSSIGSFGKSSGQFVRPKGVAVDRTGNVFVVDAAFENIQVFDEAGNLLTYFGGSYKSQGDMYLPANVIISYDRIDYFEKYLSPDYKLEYLIFVTNQYGPDRVSVYGFVNPKTEPGN